MKLIKGKRDIDSIIEERLKEISKKRNEILDENKRNFENAITESEAFMTEEELLKSVMEISKKENKNKFEDVVSDNINANNELSPSIKFIIEMGFSFDDAVMAMSAVGDDPELMLQYIYSANQN